MSKELIDAVAHAIQNKSISSRVEPNGFKWVAVDELYDLIRKHEGEVDASHDYKALRDASKEGEKRLTALRNVTIGTKHEGEVDEAALGKTIYDVIESEYGGEYTTDYDNPKALIAALRPYLGTNQQPREDATAFNKPKENNNG